MARPRLSESSQNPPRAVSESAISRMAARPMRPARRRSRIASFITKLSISLRLSYSTWLSHVDRGPSRSRLPGAPGSSFVLYEPAAFEFQGAALELGHEAGLVRREHHGGPAAPDVLDQRQDLVGHLVVQVAGGLVGQEQPRRLDDGPRQRGALRLPLGELVRKGLGSRGEPHRLERGEGLGRDVAPGRPQHAEHEGHVLEDGAAGQELRVLEHDADGAPQARDLGAAEGGDVEARHVNVALGGHFGRVEEPKQGGLARPTGAAQDDELPLGDMEGHVIESGHAGGAATEDHRHVLQPNHGLHIILSNYWTFRIFSSNNRFTTAGLAFPWVDFITWPTRKPKAAFFPARKSSATLACSASTRSTAAPSAPSSATWVSPSRLTIACAVSPERYIFSNTSLAILPLMVPSSMRASSPIRLAGGIGQAATAWSSSPGSSRSSSLSTQLATTLGLPAPRTASSK